jgi:hypothetical protein
VHTCAGAGIQEHTQRITITHFACARRQSSVTTTTLQPFSRAGLQAGVRGRLCGWEGVFHRGKMAATHRASRVARQCLTARRDAHVRHIGWASGAKGVAPCRTSETIHDHPVLGKTSNRKCIRERVWHSCAARQRRESSGANARHEREMGAGKRTSSLPQTAPPQERFEHRTFHSRHTSRSARRLR